MRFLNPTANVHHPCLAATTAFTLMPTGNGGICHCAASPVERPRSLQASKNLLQRPRETAARLVRHNPDENIKAKASFPSQVIWTPVSLREHRWPQMQDIAPQRMPFECSVLARVYRIAKPVCAKRKASERGHLQEYMRSCAPPHPRSHTLAAFLDASLNDGRCLDALLVRAPAVCGDFGATNAWPTHMALPSRPILLAFL